MFERMFPLAQDTPKQSQKQMKRVGKILKAVRKFLNGAGVVDWSQIESPVRTAASDMSNQDSFRGTDSFLNANKTTFAGLLLFLILSCFGLCLSCAADYEVTGRLAFHHLQDAASKYYRFSVAVEGCRWRIRSTNEVVEVFDFQEVYWDGTQLFHLVSQQSQIEKANKSRGPNEKQLTNVGMGFISENEILHDVVSHEIGPLWLALASHCYLSNHVSGEIIEPVVCFGLGATGAYNYWKHPFKQVAHWQLMRSPPFLPETISFIDDGILRHPGKILTLGKREPPFDSGFTNVTYSVIEATNHSGFALPAKSVIQINFVSENRLAVLAEYIITLNSFRVSQSAELRPPVMVGRTLITENRFPEAGAWTYEVTNNIWPSKELVKKSQGYQEQLNDARAQGGFALPNNTGGRRLLVLAVLFTLGALPFAYLLLLRNRKLNKTTR